MAISTWQNTQWLNIFTQELQSLEQKIKIFKIWVFWQYRRKQKAVEEGFLDFGKPLKKPESRWRRFSWISWKLESRWRKSNFEQGKSDFRRRLPGGIFRKENHHPEAIASRRCVASKNIFEQTKVHLISNFNLGFSNEVNFTSAFDTKGTPSLELPSLHSTQFCLILILSWQIPLQRRHLFGILWSWQCYQIRITHSIVACEAVL